MILALTDQEIVERLKTTAIVVLAEELGVSINVLKYHAGKASAKHRYKKKSTNITKGSYCRDILGQYKAPIQNGIIMITARNWFTIFRSKYLDLFNESYINYIETGLVLINNKSLVKTGW